MYKTFAMIERKDDSMEAKNIKKSSKNKENKGIILIALLMSIKVLIIIVAITINLLTGDNGVLKKEETNENSQEEIEEMEEDEIDENEYETMEEENENLVVNFKNINAENSNPAGTLPVKATVIEPDANKGIVIKDKNNNEWVWIEVPKDAAFSGLEIDTTKTLTSKDYEDIKNKMISYAKIYNEKQSESWKDEWYDGCGLTQQEYTQIYRKMLKSTYTYGGFWIGRYEAGIAGSVTDLTKSRTMPTPTPTSEIISASGTTVKAEKSSTTNSTTLLQKAICQKNAIPYNWVTCSEAQSLANEMTPDNKYKSSLLFGIQRDLVCKYLEVKGGLSVSEINEDSSSWGNYRNIKIENITMGKYAILDTDTSKLGEWTNIKSVFTKTNSGESSNVLLGTGISEYTNRMNIYDFSGNEWEWILEKYYDSYDPCARSGGDYCHSGSYSPAANRSYYSTTKSYNSIGFRPTFYVK